MATKKQKKERAEKITFLGIMIVFIISMLNLYGNIELNNNLRITFWIGVLLIIFGMGSITKLE